MYLVQKLETYLVGKLLTDSAVYGGAKLVNYGLRYVFIPILTYNVLPAELGAYDAARNLIVFGVPLVALGMESAVGILINDSEGKFADKEIASSGLIIVLLSSIIASLILWLYFDTLYSVLLDRDGQVEILSLAILTTILTAPTEYSRNLLKWQFRRMLFSALLVTEAALMFGVGAVLVIWFNLGVVGWMVAILVSTCFSLIVGLIANYGFWVTPHSIELIKQLLQLGIPFALVSISSGLLPIAARISLVHLAGLQEVGTYGVAERAAMTVGLLVTGFTTAWGPFYLSKQDEPRASQLYGRVALYYLIVASWIGLAVYLFGEWIIALLAPTSYAQASGFLLPLIALKLLVGFDYIVVAGIYIRQKTYHLIWIALIGGISAIVLSIVLIPPYGATGAAYAALLAQILVIGVKLTVSQKLFPLDYPTNQMLRLATALLLTAIATLLISQFNARHFLSYVLGNLLILTAFPLTCALLGVSAVLRIGKSILNYTSREMKFSVGQS